MPFDQFIGQDFVKNKLKFYLESHQRTSLTPFLLFVGAAGLGKTEFAREFGANLHSSSGERRKFIEINSSTVKTLNQFLSDIYVPHIQDQEVTIFFDEAHALPNQVVMAFLTIFNTENATVKDFQYGGAFYPFDFTKQSFIFATTESDKIFAPLRDRLTIVNFDSYNLDELGEMFTSKLNHLKFQPNALEFLCSSFRGSARNCIAMIKDTDDYARNKGIVNYTLDNAKKLCNTLGIFPQGLSQIEWRILNILHDNGRTSLQGLAAKTGLSRSALQRHHENYLLYKGYMEIDGQRTITLKGRQLINNNKKID